MSSTGEIAAPDKRRFSGRSCGLIINNNFKRKISPLPGHDFDEKNILKTFGKLNIDFTVLHNLKGHEMKGKINDWLDRIISEKYNLGCSICFILTHSNANGVILGEDHAPIEVDDIRNMFVNCTELYGIPKLFFIQACRGEIDSTAVMVDDFKTAGYVRKVKEADVFLMFATAPGKSAWVGTDGSLFIKILCEVTQAYGGKYSLQEITTKVTDILSKRILTDKENGEDVTVCEVSEVTHTLTQFFYFNDGEIIAESDN